MKVDCIIAADFRTAAKAACGRESLGYDGVWVPETNHDPFLPLTLAAQGTQRVDLGTNIAVAFARSPMQLAYQAHDLHAFSGGRLILGLGSQVKAHIEKRFGAAWSRPAARMREFVTAMRAIWAGWNSGARIDFRGDFYTHTLMTPFFTPEANPHGEPRVFLAGLGAKMTEVAGEVADGFLPHGFTTARYFREVTLPALERGLTTSGRSREDIEVCGSAFIVTGETDEKMAAVAGAVRRQIAFYGSTPQYRGVLEMHGWGDLQSELDGLAKQGRWGEMAGLIDDEIMDAFAVVGDPDHIAAKLLDRFRGVVDRIFLGVSGRIEPALFSRWIAAIKGAERPLTHERSVC